jgi:hypothetical protein
MPFAQLLSRIAAELALFAGVGFLLFAVNDLLVDLIYFGRRIWRSLTVYSRYPRAFANGLEPSKEPGFMAILIPAWDEPTVIAPMLRATLKRLDYANYAIFIGYYRNDPATAAAIASVPDDRIQNVEVKADGPTTKANCLNHLYDALVAYETKTGKSAKAVALHDAQDVVHPLELKTFDRLIDRAAVIQLPVLPLPDPNSRWVSGHYCDEFAEAHSKELVVREAVGAAIPLAGVGCAIARGPLARLASGGSLGASQAGARLIYNFNRQLGLALRTSSDVGRRGGEVALGVRVQPILGLPLWFTAERRQRLGQFGGGRNDFALFAEGGLYQRALPMRLQLDAYGEAGVVGTRTRDMFVDGGLTVTRPVFGSLSFGRSKLGAISVGAGIWGGAQPGLSRLDAGPRISVRVRSNVRVHLDWRQRLAGNARPGSGPAITLATDF